MAKVVYLLGAGASRGTRDYDNKSISQNDLEMQGNHILSGIPLVNEIPQRLKYIINRLSSADFSQHECDIPLGTNGVEEFSDAIKRLINDLQWLADESYQHATIDTFAKKLHLTNQKEKFIKLEKLLSIFFIIEQHLNKIDGRYDTFLANILNNKIEIPDNISILTWNYDSQFEIAFREYKMEDIDSPSTIGVCCKHDIGKEHCSRPKIFKLNGNASFEGFYSLGKFCKKSYQNLNDIYINDLLEIYLQDSNCSKLSFAWENDLNEFDKQDGFWQKTRNEISNAEILVVIGYSFPFFNREIDRRIFNYMPNLKKIYIQDKYPDKIEESVRNLFSTEHSTVRSTKIEKVYNTDQFYLPPEL